MDMMQTLTELTAVFGPSGGEKNVADAIETLARPYCHAITRDPMGNLICHRKGSGPKVMFAAHMDSIGLVVTHIEEKGVLRVGAVGGVPLAKVLYTPVRFQNGLRGVIGIGEGTDVAKLKVSDLFVDIGAASREEAEKLVSVGDMAVYSTPAFEAGQRMVSPYMDDRIACLVLLMAMEKLGPAVDEGANDLYFVFTTQEEVGCRGAKTAAWTVDPDYGIAVDVTRADCETGSKHGASSVFGGGAAVKVMDNSVICHPQMVEKLMKLAEAQGIKAQRDVITAGGTDAGPIHMNRSGVYTGGISIPCRYIHTPAEMVDKSDVQACIDLVAAFANSALSKEC